LVDLHQTKTKMISGTFYTIKYISSAAMLRVSDNL